MQHGMHRRLLLATIVAASLAAPAVLAQAPGGVVFERSTLVIRTAAGAELKFDVELALQDEQRMRGLMFREKMGPYEGMLFDFGQPQPVMMWMKNTLIPLDMLFIAADGTIAKVHANATPRSERTIDGGIARGVLELNGGVARMLGIRPGDRVLHPIFGTAK
jgi:uncharacterized membrane protein (UPF0127 family)